MGSLTLDNKDPHAVSKYQAPVIHLHSTTSQVNKELKCITAKRCVTICSFIHSFISRTLLNIPET